MCPVPRWSVPDPKRRARSGTSFGSRKLIDFDGLLHTEDRPMSQPHLQSSPDAVHAFCARVVARSLRHAAILGALDSLQPGETMRFARDHDPLSLRAQIAQRCGERVDVACRQREPDAIDIDRRVVRRFV